MDDKQHTSSSDDERAEIATSNQDQQLIHRNAFTKTWQFISILIGTILITAVITVVAYIFINQK